MKMVNWGIIGPGNIAANFAQGLAESGSAELVAISSRNAARRDAFAEKFGVSGARRFGQCRDLLALDHVQAVYVATPHPFHAEIAVAAMRAGKHVLVEKPMGLVRGEVVAMTEVARQQDVFLMEGWMYRCHPQMARLGELIRAGEIGKLRHIRASFGFASTFDAVSRLDDPALGGGAILDVGIYPVSFARFVAGQALKADFADPIETASLGLLGAAGADESAHALLRFDQGIVAECATSIRVQMENTAELTGTRGRIFLANPWVPGRNAGPSDAVIEVTTGDTTRHETLSDPRILFAHEADYVSRAILAGKRQAESPAPSWNDSIGNATVIDAWRASLGYALPGETPAGIRQIPGLMPLGLPQIPRIPISGLKGEISTLIMGCDNRDTLAEGAIVWDAWWEAGGNGFDTGFVYGAGRHEEVLGQWMAARGVSKQAQVIVKGAHSPYCLPDVIRVQLQISLERLQIERAPIYILHRDNPDVPVGEFVDALNALRDEGLIGAIGGSNWSAGRFAEANAYANANNLQPLTILNNNLSLAVMEKPVWPGCVTSNTAETLAFLRDSDTAHLSWSSQARGFFLAPGERSELPDDTAPDTCFASAANKERKARATALAREMGVHPHNIATAWVLGQSFPSLALIGPRSPGEIASTLPALSLALSGSDLRRLNLEADSR